MVVRRVGCDPAQGFVFMRRGTQGFVSFRILTALACCVSDLLDDLMDVAEEQSRGE